MKTTIKATYSLDATTIHSIDRLATLWSVPKSEVIRRAVIHATENRDNETESVNNRLWALKQYQQAASHLTREERAKWIDRVREERNANGP